MLAGALLLFSVGTPALTPMEVADVIALRKQVFDAYYAAGDAKIEVTMFRVEHDRWPVDAAEARIPAQMLARPERGVAEISVHAGSLQLTLGGAIDARLHGMKIGVSPCGSEALPVWTCGTAACPAGRPAVADAPEAKTITTVPDLLLLAACRSMATP